MHTALRNRSKVFFMIAALASTLMVNPVTGSERDKAVSIEQFSSVEGRLNSLEKRIGLLETRELNYGPLAISHVHLNNQNHFANVLPGQSIECSFHYVLDSQQQDFLHKKHLIVGLANVAAEVCATHLYGVWDSSGTSTFNLTAPLNAGDYEVRIAYRDGETCEEALSTWNVLGEQPSEYATIGILRVLDIPQAE
jgi:hypothetical protein